MQIVGLILSLSLLGYPSAVDSTIVEGLRHMLEGEYAAAEPLLRSAVAQLSDPARPDARLGPMLNNLGATLYYSGRMTEAEQCYLRARDEMRATVGIDYASVLNNLGTLYRSVGEFGKAESVQLEALRIHERWLDPASAEIGMDFKQLAELHFQKADYPQAEREARRAVAILEVQGVKGVALADGFQCLASILQAQDMLPEAEELQERALDLRQSLLGATDPRIAASLVALADLRMHERKYVQAEELLWRGLAIWRKNPQQYQAHVGAALNNLAQIAKLTGRFSEAERLYRNALEVWEGSVGRSSVDYGLGLGNLGDLYRVQGRLFGAADLFRQALAILEPKLGSRSPTVTGLAASLEEVGRANKWQRQQTVDFRQLLKKR